MNKDQKYTFLCVDDEEIVLLSLKEQLRNTFGQKFLYEMAQSAAEAIDIINDTEDANNAIVIIISDWLMPGMKGDEFMVYLENNFPNIKKILLTGHADPESLDRAKKDGHVDHIVTKPWSRDHLVSIIRELQESPSH
ncbi:response regulator [Leptospira perdikensis]|uniref:Response regulator n=1 Tax=Leptospira perdikensis TaxID=2484948 RepID=A0A4R9J5Y6_9LEPT|nr:response regulator [Leptospira perdikensis]TGL33504.1 response regulator [Leptospira perdikensis]